MRKINLMSQKYVHKICFFNLKHSDLIFILSRKASRQENRETPLEKIELIFILWQNKFHCLKKHQL